MSAESIVSLDVGGTIFHTSPSTMLKYPDSKLARMYNDQNQNQNIKNLNFFLDKDPEYFRIVLNFLREGEVIHFEEENLFVGVRGLAKYLELTELVKLLEKEYGFSTVVFEFRKLLFSDMPNEMTIARRFLTRVPESNLAKFFFGEQGSQNPLSKWIFKKGPNRYFISNHKAGLTKYILKFMEMPANTPFSHQNFSIDFVKELEIYGIQEFDHFKKLPSFISWNENYNVN